MHRDLKPANILVTRDRRTLKLTDFGLAKRFPRCDDASPPSQRHRLQREHTCNIGTPRYTAPEVLEHLMVGDVDTQHAVYTEKADVYSAALIMWYILTGWMPPCDVRKNPRARPDPRTARRRWGEMAELLERMWAHDAEARPTAGECAAAVRGMIVRGAGCGPAGTDCSVQ